MKTLLPLFFIVFSLNVTLWAETEPNDSESQANLINFNQQISGNFQKENDNDYYYFDLTMPGLITIKLASLDLDANIFCAVREDNLNTIGYGSNIKLSGKQDGQFSIYLCKAGKYYLEFHELKGKISTADYDFNMIFNNDDKFECNNTLSTASPIQLNQTIQANLNGYVPDMVAGGNDYDFYKIQIPGKGILNLDLNLANQGKEIHIYLYDEQGEIVAHDCNFDSILPSSIKLQRVFCEPGSFYICVSSFNINQKEDNDAYQLTINFVNDSSECNDSLKQAFPIELRKPINASLGGINASTKEIDVDWYSFIPDHAGDFDISFESPDSNYSYYVSVYNPDESLLFNSSYDDTFGFNFWTSKPLCEHGTYYCKIQNKNSDNCRTKFSFTPYKMKVDVLVPDDYECNNQISNASPVNGNDVIMASFPFYEDNDVYQILLGKFDTLHVSFETLNSGFLHTCKIYDPKNIARITKTLTDSLDFVFVNNTNYDKLYISLTGHAEDRTNCFYNLKLQTSKFLTGTKQINELPQILINTIATDYLYIDMDENQFPEINQYKICDVTGRIILEEQLSQLEKSISISNLENGIYYIMWMNKEFKSMEKFIKMN